MSLISLGGLPEALLSYLLPAFTNFPVVFSFPLDASYALSFPPRWKALILEELRRYTWDPWSSHFAVLLIDIVTL